MTRTKNGGMQTGFTIVELMVATLVFSVILVVITSGVIYIARTYYKGVTLNRTQDAARSVMDAVSQSIQFSDSNVSWPQPPTDHPEQTVLSGAGCVGSQRYDFQLGYQLTPNPTQNDQATHGLTLTTGVANCASSSGTFTAGTTELLAQKMRLSRLSVVQKSAASNLYQVNVTVVYGDYDLLCDTSYAPTASGGCGAGAPPVNLSQSRQALQAFMASPTIACRSGEGSAYCAVSALSTVVQQRLPSKE